MVFAWQGILGICLGWAVGSMARKGQTVCGYLHFFPWNCSDPSPGSWVSSEQSWLDRPGVRVCIFQKCREHLQIGNLWRKVFLALCLICQSAACHVRPYFLLLICCRWQSNGESQILCERTRANEHATISLFYPGRLSCVSGRIKRIRRTQDVPRK